MKKFELTTETKIVLGKKVFRIKALVGFGEIKYGELGGFVEREDNLSHEGNAWVSGNDGYATMTGFGSENRTTTFFRQKDGSIGVRCGCFYGTIDDFKEKVRKTHGDTKYAKEYLAIADLMEMHFNDEVE